MEQKHISCGSVCDQLPTMSVKYPWLVAQNLEAKEDCTDDQIFYTMQSTHLSLWECWLHDDQGDIEYGTSFKPTDEIMVRPVLRILCFKYLVVLDKHQGIITFTDPMFGDKYFIKMPQKLIGDLRICYSGYGWLLLYKLNGPGELFFFNPFTKDIRELPNAPYFDSVYVLAPPTSPNCVVIGLLASLPLNMFFYDLTWEPSSWARCPMDFRGTTPRSFLFLTIFSKQILALNQGALNIFRRIEGSITYLNAVAVESPRGSSAQYFLVKCNQHLLLVVMDELGEFVEVLKLTGSPLEWEKIDSLGSHMIYICGSTCLCMEAKTPEMENKIYFPRLDSKDGNIVFYSLETRRYHTVNGRNIQQCSEDFFGTKYHVYPHAWIQPSWLVLGS